MFHDARPVGRFSVDRDYSVGKEQRTAPAAASKPSAPADKHGDDAQKLPGATDIAADAPVLTVKGLCAPVTTTGAERTQSVCQTVVTRAQLEKLFDALRPGMDVESKRHLDKAYPQFLVWPMRRNSVAWINNHGLRRGWILSGFRSFPRN
jgi:hypothetical protein